MPNRAKEELLKVLTCGRSHDYKSDPLSGFPYWRNEKARDGHFHTHHINSSDWASWPHILRKGWSHFAFFHVIGSKDKSVS